MFDLTFSELLFPVLLGDFHLEYLVFTDEGGHLGQTLSTRAPDTNQQHVAPELTDHTYYTGYCGGKTKILPILYCTFHLKHLFTRMRASYIDCGNVMD